MARGNRRVAQQRSGEMSSYKIVAIESIEPNWVRQEFCGCPPMYLQADRPTVQYRIDTEDQILRGETRLTAEEQEAWEALIDGVQLRIMREWR